MTDQFVLLNRDTHEVFIVADATTLSTLIGVHRHTIRQWKKEYRAKYYKHWAIFFGYTYIRSGRGLKEKAATAASSSGTE